MFNSSASAGSFVVPALPEIPARDLKVTDYGANGAGVRTNIEAPPAGCRTPELASANRIFFKHICRKWHFGTPAPSCKMAPMIPAQRLTTGLVGILPALTIHDLTAAKAKFLTGVGTAGDALAVK